MMMNNSPKDYDLATDATPQQMLEVYKDQRIIPTGEQFGTMTVIENGEQYQITTYRTEQDYINRRKPSQLRFGKSLEEDLSRRDLTINAMAMDPQTNEVIDPYHGKDDIANKTIRTVGNPEERFDEDSLRMMRACRFQSRLGFEMSPETREAIKKHAPEIKEVSSERIRDEVLGILQSDKPSIGIECMKETGLLAEVIPEVNNTVGVEQPRKYHISDVYGHTLGVIDELPAKDPNLRMAGLLHDIGKPDTKKFVPEKGRDMFIGHEDISATLARERLKSLKFPATDVDWITNIIANHMLKYQGDWSNGAVRRWINKVGGIENAAELIAHKRADCRAARENCDDLMDDLQTRINNIPSPIVSAKTLAIDGNDVMNALNIKPGPEVGANLKALEDMVMEEPDINTRDHLLQLLKDIQH